MFLRLFPIAMVVFGCVGCLPAQADEPTAPTAEQLDFFESNVRPLLIDHCYDCHSVEADTAEGGLVVDSRQGLAKGGSLGPALVTGDPGKSLLMKAVLYRDSDLQMPPSGKLETEQIDILRQWIAMGAPDPRSGEVQTESTSPLERDPSSHWAFRVPERPTAPSSHDARSADVLDDYAAAKATEQGIEISPTASRETLVRRLYFDLTGLPPSREQIEAFVTNERPDAYRRLVDQLLASPAFAERFARHWLDVARYADTVGYALAGRERRYQGSERYRDWTIQAFASDMPYDEMIVHQLAADRTDPNNDQGNLDAMGFLTLGRKFLNRLDVIDDRIDVVTRGLMGLTVSCARCHDHKFDPIPSADYYSLAGIFHSSTEAPEEKHPFALVDKDNPRDAPVLLRGQPGNRGPIAPRQFLTAFRAEDEPRFSDGSGRLELAQRIAASSNPLTARVMVNRLWMHLIGKPLVDTPSDFGFRTEPPKVAAVLEDLSAEFADHWSIKKTIRRIVLTRIYRQRAGATPAALAKDPDNQFLARGNRKRRDFESLRDSALAVSGKLDRRMGGPPVEITLDTPSPRRTVYAMIDRQNLPSLFRTFDFANPDAHSPRRYFTTVPQQALFLLNNPQMMELARRTASQVREQIPNGDPAAQVASLFARVLGRKPTAKETTEAVRFLTSPSQQFEPPLDPRSLWSYGTATLDENHALSDFEPFNVFKDNRWQAANEFPTESPYGYAFLDNENGHTPNAGKLATVRRFTAPVSGRVRLQGQMGHRNDQGDGVQTTIWIGPRKAFHATQKKSNRPYGPIKGEIEAGQTIDLVAAPGESPSFDSYFWRVSIQLVGTDGQVIETESSQDFSGPFDPDSTQPLDRLGQLAQALLMSNEFAFVD